MKTLFLITCLLLYCQNGFGQEKELRIENRKTLKEITIKENRRIRVITKTGETFNGRFKVLNKNSIALDGVVLGLNEISIIKKHPLLATILIKANFFHMGTIIFFASIVVSSFTGVLPIALFGLANLAGGVFGGLTISNISKSYNVERDWNFEIIGAPSGGMAKRETIKYDKIEKK